MSRAELLTLCSSQLAFALVNSRRVAMERSAAIEEMVSGLNFHSRPPKRIKRRVIHNAAKIQKLELGARLNTKRLKRLAATVRDALSALGKQRTRPFVRRVRFRPKRRKVRAMFSRYLLNRAAKRRKKRAKRGVRRVRGRLALRPIFELRPRVSLGAAVSARWRGFGIGFLQYSSIGLSVFGRGHTRAIALSYFGLKIPRGAPVAMERDRVW